MASIRIGAHVPLSRKEICLLYSQGFVYFQFFLGAPQSFSNISTSWIPLAKAQVVDTLSKDITLVVHGKYCYNFIKGDSLSERTYHSICDQIHVCKELGIKLYVTHVGAMYSQMESQQGIVRTREQCLENWHKMTLRLLPTLKECGVKLCYECTPGVKSGTYMGSIEDLLWLVNEVHDYESIGFCLDTQHAYANGEVIYRDDKKLFYDDLILRASVIHLNGNETGCEFGAHKDRHSSTLLIESYKLPFNKLKRVVEIAKCPVILERDGMYRLVCDKEALEGNLENHDK